MRALPQRLGCRKKEDERDRGAEKFTQRQRHSAEAQMKATEEFERKPMAIDYEVENSLEEKILSKSVVYATQNDGVCEDKLFQNFN